MRENWTKEDLEFYKSKIDYDTAVQVLVDTAKILGVNFALCDNDFNTRCHSIAFEAARARESAKKYYKFCATIREITE